MNKTFYGHGRLAILWNVILAVMAPVNAAIFSWLFNNFDLPLWFLIIDGWLILIFYPNPTYLFMEIKHLLLTDGIADDRPLGAVIVFGLMSISGFVLQIMAIVIFVHEFSLLNAHSFWSILVLSFLAALGGAIGQLDIASFIGLIYPPIILRCVYKVMVDRTLLLLTLGITLLLSIVSFVVLKLI